MPKKKKSQKTNPEAAASAESADTRQNKLQTSREARIAEIEAKYAKRSAVLENNNKALTQEIEKQEALNSALRSSVRALNDQNDKLMAKIADLESQLPKKEQKKPWLERKPTLDLKASFIHVFKLSGDKTLPGTLAPMGVIESIPDSIEAVKKAVTDEYGSGDYVLRGISENEKTGERRFAGKLAFNS